MPNYTTTDHERSFCDYCGVSLDLHTNPNQPSRKDCESADRKAQLIESCWVVGR